MKLFENENPLQPFTGSFSLLVNVSSLVGILALPFKKYLTLGKPLNFCWPLSSQG